MHCLMRSESHVFKKVRLTSQKKKREARFSPQELWTANVAHLQLSFARNTACLLELASPRIYRGQPINIEDCFYALKGVPLWVNALVSTVRVFVGRDQSLKQKGREIDKYLRGSSRILGDSSVTVTQWWRARHLRNIVIRRSPVRFRPKTRQLRFSWIWAHIPSNKGFKLLFPVMD